MFALSLNVNAKEVPFYVIAGVVRIPLAFIVLLFAVAPLLKLTGLLKVELALREPTPGAVTIPVTERVCKPASPFPFNVIAGAEIFVRAV